VQILVVVANGRIGLLNCHLSLILVLDLRKNNVIFILVGIIVVMLTWLTPQLCFGTLPLKISTGATEACMTTLMRMVKHKK
jgi:hypothetical protein